MHGEKLANPGPLGLLGFGMTTVLLNLHNANILPLSVVIVAMGFAMGGAAQIVAGIMEFKKDNLFGATAFTAYGFFWWSLIFIWCNPLGNAQADATSMGFYLLLWGIFTSFMFVCTLKHNVATRIVFLSLAVLFMLLAISDFADSSSLRILAGYIGIFCGLSAIYASLAQVVNSEYGRAVMPLGEPR